jgi:CRISPR-associated endonuclease/helicase Cas3
VELLAKSPRGQLRVTLEAHSRDTQLAANQLFRPGSRWRTTFLRFFKLRESEGDRFLLNLQVASLFHDLGKANEDFQNAMRSNGCSQQAVRHEHLSALLITYSPVWDWLGLNSVLDRDCIVAAVLSHHIKAGSNEGPYKLLCPRRSGKVQLLLEEAQIKNVFSFLADIAELPPVSIQFPAYFDGESDGWSDTQEQLQDNADRFRRALAKGRDVQRHGFSLALKAALLASDSASSGLVREGHDITSWIENTAHRAAIEPNGVETAILAPRKSELGAKFTGYLTFQGGAAAIGRRGLLLAGCGAGKTIAAWRWADQVVRAEQIGRVIFLYPTRGTATEGFRDYVAHAPEGEAALVHGTSAYELAGMQANPSERPNSIKGKKVDVDESEARLFSLGLWGKKYFSATVDQFLSFMENGYGGICLLPALADAAVVFDEVHSYDSRMWNALVKFLEVFDVPVLCMTATLPPGRKSNLEKFLTTYPKASDRDSLQDLEASEGHKRYIIHSTTRSQAKEAALDAYRFSRRRVLWVVNTVDRCQELARDLSSTLQQNVLVYHSRFTLKDRQSRHRQVVDAFQWSAGEKTQPVIAVTTQVCEMSLDLDADVLITENAPISSLIQRFGRANRHGQRNRPDFKADVYAYEPETVLPYSADDLIGVKEFLANLDGQAVSQLELSQRFEQFGPKTRDPSGDSAFLDGGYYAVPGNLREDDDTGCTAVLDRQIDEYLRSDRDKQPGYRLSVPKRFAQEDSRLGQYLFSAPAERYDVKLGFRVGEIDGPERTVI